MILAIRTDKPEAEIYLIENSQIKDSIKWQAHRELSNTLLIKIDELLSKQNIKLSNLTALVVFQGPGSFTGLRIGITLMNSLSYSLSIPVVGSMGDDWINEGLKNLNTAKKGDIIIPHYGSEANITAPRK